MRSSFGFRGVIRTLVTASLLICGRPASSDGAPRGAFLDFDRSPLGGAIEAKLITAPDTAWVERTQFDAVLAEQRLQNAFSPEGSTTRRELAGITKADALILLRKRKPQAQPVGARPLGRGPMGTSPIGDIQAGAPPVGSRPMGTRPSGAATSGSQMVMPRQFSPPTTVYDLVVCETKHGLRLLSLTLTESQQKPIDAAAIAATILARIKHADQDICHVYTVPPIVSRDISYKYLHLQRSFAELLTARLLEQPGVAVVETAEARAIAAERIVGGAAGANSDFAEPVFVTGEFRSAGEGEALRYRLQLTARRGEAIVGTPLDREVAPKEVSTALATWGDELLTATAGLKPRPIDAEAEATRLQRAGRDLLTWDNPDEAWAVAEAGLLLKPDDLTLRRTALDAVSEVFRKHSLICRVEPSVWPPLRVAYYRLVDHLEFLARHGESISKGLAQPPWHMSSFGRVRSVYARHDEVSRPIFEELTRDEETTLLRLYHISLGRGHQVDANHYVKAYLTWLPLERRYAELVRLVLEYPQDKIKGDYLFHMLHGPFEASDGKDLAARITMLRELQAHTERPEIVRIAMISEKAALHSYVIRLEQKIDQLQQTTLVDVSAPASLYRPIQWKVRRKTFADNSSPGTEVLQTLPPEEAEMTLVKVGPKLDFAHNDRELFLVREPGVLEPLPRPEFNARFYQNQSRLCFDGRFAWMIASDSRQQHRRIIVVEPATERVWTSEADLGMPEAPTEGRRTNLYEMSIAPIAEGEVFAVVSFGRTVLTRIRFTPDAPKPFETSTVYECPEQPTRKQIYEEWKNPRIHFRASYLVPVTAAENSKTATHVLVGRGNAAAYQEFHPLLVELATGKTEVIEDRLRPTTGLWSGGGGIRVRGADIFFINLNYATPDPLQLSRLDVRTKKIEVLDDDAPSGYLFFAGAETHIIGNRWWKKPAGGKFARVTPLVPWEDSGFKLSHGTVFDKLEDGASAEKLYQLKNIHESAHHGRIATVYKMSSTRLHYTLQLPDSNAATAEAGSPSSKTPTDGARDK